ncbi:MAG: tetratricopeptide repeat protein [Nitrospiraceae bacterium]|nr:tetratricopeptide repeat protein [Nitrospiraceae bacterium]
MINCPYCGKLTDPKLESCPHCGGYVQKVPGQPQAAAGGAKQTCPNCHALVQDGDIICVACGTNLLTGQKIAEEKKEKEAVARGKAPLMAVGAAVLVVLVLIGVAYAFYAFTRDPVDQATQMALAGNLLDASEVLDAHIEKHQDDARAQLVSGKVRWEMGQFPRAADAFEAALKLDRQNAEAGMLAVLSLASAGSQSRARQIAILRQITEQHPDNLEAWRLLALELGAENEVDGQMEALRKVLDLTVSPTAATRQSLGIALALQGDYAAAQRELNGAMAEAEQQADVAAALGLVANLGGSADEAETLLRGALDGGTSIREQALTRLGMLLIGQGNFSEAQGLLTQAIAANRQNTTAQFFYAVCLQANGLLLEALNEFETVAQAGGLFAVEASVRVADIMLGQGDPEKARSAVERAEQAGGSSAALRTMRGRVMVALGQDNSAREAFQRAMAADPAYAPVHLEAGLLNIKQQRFAEGVAELDKYLALLGPDAQRIEFEGVRTLVSQIKQATGAGGQAPGAAGFDNAGRNAS